MIWGNLIVFCLAIGIVCLVDFSTIALDEPTKRLLYLEIDDKVYLGTIQIGGNT